MGKLECIRLQRVNPRIDEYLKKLIQEISFELSFLDWDGHYVNEGFPTVIMLEPDSLLELKVFLEKRKEKVIIALNSRKDFKVVTELKSYYSKIFGFMDITQEIEYNIPLVRNYLELNFTNPAYDLKNVDDELKSIQEQTQTQLIQIKNLHERLIKMRVDKFSKVYFTSKFMSGEKSGGEFFDFIKNEKELIMIQVGSTSYNLSSFALSELEALKEKTFSEKLEDEVMLFEKAITLHAHENNSEVSYCIINLNLKTLVAKFSFKGVGTIFYQNEFIYFDKPLVLKINPNDRLCLISQGAVRNWEILNPKKSFKTFFQENVKLESKEFINEFFLELSRNKSGKFLIHDALMEVLEIEDSVVHHLHLE